MWSGYKERELEGLRPILFGNGQIRNENVSPADGPVRIRHSSHDFGI